MKSPFEIVRQTRKNLLGSVRNFNTDQLNFIPTGFNNNLIWNLGHVLVSQQLLTYQMSGLSPNVEQSLIEKYRKGSGPDGKASDGEIQSIKDQFFTRIDETEADYQAGKFHNFQGYTSAYGLELKTIEDVLDFDNLHEALHLGYVLSIRKFVSAEVKG
ncbi:MAG: DinB family protein [Saprospiraceae bacterium]|nr:DinB family protein [Saprospiraceae bacterium]